MELLIGSAGSIFFIILFIVVISIRQINQYERGVKFSFGKYSGTVSPGWRVVLPIFQSMVKVDMRTRVIDVPDQESLTKDNISIRINAVVYFRVVNAEKAILEVEQFYYAMSQLAQTTMRNVVGEETLDHLLANRDESSARIRGIIDKLTDPWGISVENVELKDMLLPPDLTRTMAKVAEADRERQAVIIKAEGEVAASDNMAKAATMLATAPGALHLRTLQTINDLSSDQSNTTIWMVPVEALSALSKIGDIVKPQNNAN
jgi:regulator of protease activity HflC (stomatin/prohibitin superfamily)